MVALAPFGASTRRASPPAKQIRENPTIQVCRTSVTPDGAQGFSSLGSKRLRRDTQNSQLRQGELTMIWWKERSKEVVWSVCSRRRPLKKSVSESSGATAGLSSSVFPGVSSRTAGQASSGTLSQRAAKDCIDYAGWLEFFDGATDNGFSPRRAKWDAAPSGYGVIQRKFLGAKRLRCFRRLSNRRVRWRPSAWFFPAENVELG